MLLRLSVIVFLGAISASCVTVEEPVRSNRTPSYNPALAAKNLKASKVFLASERFKPGVKATQSDLLYRVLKPGSGCNPMANSSVKVHYSGRLAQSQSPFDSSYKRGQPNVFPLSKMIPAWREAIPMMKEGAIWELIVPPQLGYGARGLPPIIPANSALVFKIELLEASTCKPQKYKPGS